MRRDALARQQEAAAQYQAHLDQTLPGPGEFVVDSDSRADWALRKLAEARGRLRSRQAFVEAEIARLQEWQTTLDREDVGTIRFMEWLLSAYFERLRRDGRLVKKKRYRLPHGQLIARQMPAQWEVDAAQLLAWAEPLGLVRVEKALAWNEIKARLTPAAPEPGAAAIDTTTGELVPGVTLKAPAGLVFRVKTEDDSHHDSDL